MRADTSRDPVVYASIAALLAAILALDAYTRVGFAEWVFYLIPLALCVFQSRSWFPLATAVVITALVGIGFELSAAGIDAEMAKINRAFALVAIWSVAILTRRVLVEKERARRLAWIQQGQAQVAASMLGEQTVEELGRNFMDALGRYMGAHVGVAARLEGGVLVPTGGFAFDPQRHEEGRSRPLHPGEGLAGQVVASAQPMLVTRLPPGYLRVSSGVGQSAPTHLLIGPIIEAGKAAGVVELGFIADHTDFGTHLELLGKVAADIGIALRSALYRQRLQELLHETQQQGEELQAQQEELRVSNEELEEQGRALRESQGRLENQHAELEQTNVQLEEQTQRLERQKRELLRAQEALNDNAKTLERSSRYKSEFLANMSHELRTPLNSSLILAKLLADNAQGNLDDEQVRFARTIHSSNNDLLTLINDILDLSKIEAGQVDIQPEKVTLDAVLDPLRQMFDPIAADRKVAFRIERASNAPATLVTDNQRVQQILKNLLSNAIKFTAKGEVTLQVSTTPAGRVAFAVRDTGIGIPQQHQEAIFEAFRQADGTTSRQFGGTGLGLSISRELARLLDGQIRLKSAPGQGSTFTLEIPATLATHAAAARSEPERAPQPMPAPQPAAHRRPALKVAQSSVAPTGPHIDDDRTQRRHRDRLILVVEDDPRFARVLYDLAHELAFDCVHCSTAAEAVELARRLRPSGILLDVSLPDESGLTVLERIKRDPAVRHIPVHMVSVDDHSQAALGLGAIGYALKPVAREELVKAIGRLEERLQKRVSRVLVVEDDATMRANIALLLKGDAVDITTVGTVAEALAQVEAHPFDCMVTDLALPDGSGYDLLEKLSEGGRHSFLPVIVYTGRALSRDEETRLRRFSKSIIIKGARSPERLLDEVTLFLHRVESTLPQETQNILRRVRQRDAVFEGRTILLAEDDVRNIFALTRVLEPLGAQVEIARNGQEAVDRVAKGDIDLVLMDIMMPVKDGLAAMREIRATAAWARLPIIAITAKAMPEDRKQCLEAGANDYIAKPIDVDQLVSLCRVWMPK
jgi:signal transduction histidine kinase/DNA-binding response OmpR family regulator